MTTRDTNFRVNAIFFFEFTLMQILLFLHNAKKKLK